jgi:type IV secretory pathway VirB10-like protein
VIYMKKSIVIAIVGVLVVAGIGSAAYFQTTKKPSVGSAVVATEQEATVPSADDMEAQVKEVVAAREAELEAQKAAEEEAARVAAEQAAAEQAAKEEEEKAAKEKEQVANNNTGKGNTTAKSNKSGSTGTKDNGSTSSTGSSSASTSSNEENPYGFTEDDLPNLAPGTTIDIGEPTRSYDIPGGGTANVYDHISDDELNEHLN